MQVRFKVVSMGYMGVLYVSLIITVYNVGCVAICIMLLMTARGTLGIEVWYEEDLIFEHARLAKVAKLERLHAQIKNIFVYALVTSLEGIARFRDMADLYSASIPQAMTQIRLIFVHDAVSIKQYLFKLHLGLQPKRVEEALLLRNQLRSTREAKLDTLQHVLDTVPLDAPNKAVEIALLIDFFGDLRTLMRVSPEEISRTPCSSTSGQQWCEFFHPEPGHGQIPPENLP
jgi:hypothetical protein